jgi:ribonuclease HII
MLGFVFFTANFCVRIALNSDFDLKFFETYDDIIGCDEVGRGPIAGPVNGCAVLINKKDKNLVSFLQNLNVTDSKKLSTKKRLTILDSLNIDVTTLKVNNPYRVSTLDGEFHFVLGEKSPQEIDDLNILQASLLCMKEASAHFVSKKSIILIDGNKSFDSQSEVQTVIKGDTKSTIIAIASIIAKEFRDHLMQEYDKEFPGYGLAAHAGYPTVKHKEAVKNLGVTEIHRKSFKGVKEYI